MKERSTRRDLLRLGVAAGAASVLASDSTSRADDLSQQHVPLKISPVEGTEKLTVYPYGGQVLYRWNNHVVAAYRANPEQKYPYFSDLAGPVTGLPLTTESSLPYPHHRGLWLGCDPLHGGDYWKDSGPERGKICSKEIELIEQSPIHATIRNHCEWHHPRQATLLSDDRNITVQIIDDHRRAIDFDIQLTAMRDIRIGKAKHSFFAIRVAPDLAPVSGGTLVNSDGLVGEGATYGQPANWCGYYGKRAGSANVTEGIAVMDHPENPWAPCPWFTRDYGHLSPSPFNFLGKDWCLAEGESIRMRYRVVLHAGTAEEADLHTLYAKWVSGTV